MTWELSWIVIYSEGLHSLAGLLLLAPLWLTFSGLRLGKITTVLLFLFLFWLAWFLHIQLDGLQNIF